MALDPGTGGVLGIPYPRDLAVNDLEMLDAGQDSPGAVAGDTGEFIGPRSQCAFDDQVDGPECELFVFMEEAAYSLAAVCVAHFGDFATGVVAVHRVA